MLITYSSERKTGTTDTGVPGIDVVAGKLFAQVAEITLELVRLTPLMRLSGGRREVAIALIDGPVWMGRAELWSANVEVLDQTLRRSGDSFPGRIQ